MLGATAVTARRTEVDPAEPRRPTRSVRQLASVGRLGCDQAVTDELDPQPGSQAMHGTTGGECVERLAVVEPRGRLGRGLHDDRPVEPDQQRAAFAYDSPSDGVEVVVGRRLAGRLDTRVEVSRGRPGETMGAEVADGVRDELATELTDGQVEELLVGDGGVEWTLMPLDDVGLEFVAGWRTRARDLCRQPRVVRGARK